MNARVALIGFSLFLLPLLVPAQDMKLPVFFLRYDGGVGSEQIEPENVEEELFEASSQRHKLTLRIKEEWSEQLVTNLYTAVARKLYPGSYTWFYLNPDFAWDLTDRLQWSTGFRSKWTFYDEPDSFGNPLDFTSLLLKTELTLRLMRELKLVPFVQGVLDLYENEEKSQQTYVAGLGVESRLRGDWRLSGRYRGILRLPLPDSLVSGRFNHEFGVNLSWDPN
ncbi:MAG: hypothetical protein A2V99_01300 [Spirochaetes bacterium RBG_16_67_19]|nr:MAG: hypothetical protein A2V99_01300 [Spirochaetes bacterium RBG_16_67_19]